MSVTAFEMISLPFWLSGAYMCMTAISISQSPVKDPMLRRTKLTDCFAALMFAAVLLTVAAKMWSSNP